MKMTIKEIMDLSKAVTSKYRSRSEIKTQIRAVTSEIENLEERLSTLFKEDMLYSDDLQQFNETIEMHKDPSDRRKKPKPKQVGRVHFISKYGDESTGDIVEVERAIIVRENGEWTEGYFTPNRE